MRPAGDVQRIQTEQYHTVIHRFPKEMPFECPSAFTDPFRYAPHPAVQSAASAITERIDSDPHLSESFKEGKMLGVLVCHDMEGRLGYLAAFSGNIGSRSNIEGFVPPIFDLADPEGYFRKEEARISEVNRRIAELNRHGGLKAAQERLAECIMSCEAELRQTRSAMMESKIERDAIRQSTSDEMALARLTRQSQHEKAGFRRLKASWAQKIDVLQKELDLRLHEIERLKIQRAEMSDKLQNWIFRQYIVHNSLGEESSIADIFSHQSLTPPGGTGECAAPKLLEYAFLNGLKPLAMGEFWYGKSPDTAVRTHGHFYPSCTSKCGPLLKFMLKGLAVHKDSPTYQVPSIIYEDDAVLVAEKPCGMPSVPGLDGKESLQEWLSGTLCPCNGSSRTSTIHAVHRLDMDTSGVMVFAKTHEAAVNLRQQFEEHAVRKTYIARLSYGHRREQLSEVPEGTITLPLSPDYDERPRQKADSIQGKPAVTEYKVLSFNHDGTTDIIFHPVTGRTHQLRVHSAHTLGLGLPIVGDLLYGGSPHPRLYLHASSISFRHPVTGEAMTFTGENGVWDDLTQKPDQPAQNQETI